MKKLHGSQSVTVRRTNFDADGLRRGYNSLAALKQDCLTLCRSTCSCRASASGSAAHGGLLGCGDGGSIGGRCPTRSLKARALVRAVQVQAVAQVIARAVVLTILLFTVVAAGFAVLVLRVVAPAMIVNANNNGNDMRRRN